MALISASLVAHLREKTGVGMMDAKRALEESGGDEVRAIELLRKKGMKAVEKRQDRVAREGVIEAYVHSNARVGALLNLACETDFVARNAEFRSLAHEIALHIAAMNPRYLSPTDIPQEVLEKEQEIYREQARAEKKPEAMIDKIVEGKMQKFYRETCLLEQVFVKDESKTVKDLIMEATAKIGEKIEIREFVRMNI
ncbi:MAG: translation elongation factor Ts [Patescibacteria group bacterium]